MTKYSLKFVVRFLWHAGCSISYVTTFCVVYIVTTEVLCLHVCKRYLCVCVRLLVVLKCRVTLVV